MGYFYEKDGPDWGYFLGTHHSDIHAAWHYAHNTDRAKYFIEKEERWYDWLSYNAVYEAHDLAEEDLEIRYALGQNGLKTVQFTRHSIEVVIQHTGSFTEIIPLLYHASDALQTNDHQLTLKRNGLTFTIASDNLIVTRDTPYTCGNYSVVAARISANSDLTYCLGFA